MLSKIVVYSILLIVVSSVIAENDVRPSEHEITATSNTERCVYRGDEYRCEFDDDCTNKGGESLHRCKNGLSCCIDDYFWKNNYNLGWDNLINHIMGNFRDLNWFYDLPFFSWLRSSSSINRQDNNYSDSDNSSDVEVSDDKTIIKSSGHDKDDLKISGEFVDSDSHDNSITLYIDQTKSSNKKTHNEEGKHGDNYHGCGEPRLRIKRIVGGRSSKFGHHPWQVALFKPTLKDQPFCGGALLNDRWILTAAHCVDEKKIETLKVRLGEYDVISKREELHHKEYRVMKKRVHPKYVHEGHRNDVALLKLDGKVTFDRHIIPICLPGPDLIPIGKEATVTGWGRRHYESKQSAPPILHEVEVEIISNDACHARLLDAGHDRTIDDIFICAGNRNGGRGSCKGDSGGPLSISVDGRNVLIGVVSWGFSCGKNRSPGVYANVQKFVPWILEKID